MTTVVRQSKTFSGLVANDAVVDLTPDEPTLPGSICIVAWYFESPNNNRLLPFTMDDLEPGEFVEGMDVFTGWGDNYDYRSSNYIAGMHFGPAQPTLTGYHVCKAWVLDEDPVPLTAVLYEISSDLGPIVPYGSYGMRTVGSEEEVETFDWISVYTGYNKPRPMFAFDIVPDGDAPEVDGFSGVNIDVGEPSIMAKIADVNYTAGESHQINMSDAGFIGYFTGVVAQSQYETVQHFKLNDVDTVTPATLGDPVTPKNLLLLSARYKNENDFLLEGWNLLSKTSQDDPDQLTTVVWWKQAGNAEPSSYTAPGSPLNLNFREVSGFPDTVRLAAYAYQDPSAWDSAPSPVDEGWTKKNLGEARLGDFPDNDAFFFSAVSFPEEVAYAMSLPEPNLYFNEELLDTGAGWDFFPDGYGSLGIITVLATNGEMGSSSGGPGYTAVGAVFFNAPETTRTVPNPKWSRTMEPNFNYLSILLQAGFRDVYTQIDYVQSLIGGGPPAQHYIVPSNAGQLFDGGDVESAYTIAVQYSAFKYTIRGIPAAATLEMSFVNPGSNRVARFYLSMETDLSAPPTYPGNVYGDVIEAAGFYEVIVIGQSEEGTGSPDSIFVTKVS